MGICAWLSPCICAVLIRRFLKVVSSQSKNTKALEAVYELQFIENNEVFFFFFFKPGEIVIYDQEQKVLS